MGDTTKLTEIVTGLAMLGGPHPLDSLPVRPNELRNVDDETWEALVATWADPAIAPLVDAAFDNGRFFLRAADALRGRPPRLVEWTGPTRSPGDEVAPVDLRVDHVYLVSCKYLSKITMNASPAHLFDRLLTGGHGRRSTDWYRDVAPVEFDTLWRASTAWLLDEHPELTLPASLDTLDRAGRKEVSAALRTDRRGWPEELSADYDALCHAVAERSAARWRAAIDAAPANASESMLWRLLRIGSAPYFVLGSGRSADLHPLRLRVASPWDFRQHFTFRRLHIAPQAGGQPMVSWRADLIERTTGADAHVEGHIEVRWSHGRFSGPPEAKVYLDTPFGEVPGYWTLD